MASLVHKGNPKLKRLNQSIQWSEQLTKEYLKCENDPVYFAQKYIKVMHVDHGLVQMDPYPYQKDIIKSVTKNRYTIVLTSRQAGKTTAVVAAILHYILFNDAKVVGILANRATTARQILGRVKLAYENLPKWLQHGVKVFNEGSFILENESQVLADATNSDSVRGWSLSMLFIDEAAFVEKWDSFFASVYPTITSGKKTKVVLVSTPKGMNHYYKLWTDANKPEPDWNRYHPIKVTWEAVPGRDQAWAVEQVKLLGSQKRFDQEMSAKFLGSSFTLIEGFKLETMVWERPLKEDTRMAIFETPIEGNTYVLTADVSHGKGFDYSAFNVIDVTKFPFRQVARFNNNSITPEEYAEYINRTSRHYNKASILVENNDIGAKVLHILTYDLDAENVLSTANRGRDGKQLWFGEKSEPGVKTTKTTKAQGCSLLKELIERDQLIIRDADTISQLSTFSKKDSISGLVYQAEQTCYDDIVMSLVIFAWMTDDPYFKALTDINIRDKIREQTSQAIEESALSFAFSSEEETMVDETQYFDDPRYIMDFEVDSRVKPKRPPIEDKTDLFSDYSMGDLEHAKGMPE